MLNLYGPMNQLGYGIFFNGLVSHLIHMTDCTVVPIGPIQMPQMQEELREAIERQDSFQFDAPSVCLFHEYMLNTFTGKPMIGFPIFETTKIRPRGLHMMQQMDFNWVPSTWAQKICIDHGIHNTHVVPGGVNPIIFNPDVKPCKPFVNPNVFTIVNIGKFEERKGHKVIVELLQERFANQDIRLLASWTNNFIPNFMENLQQGFTQRGWIHY